MRVISGFAKKKQLKTLKSKNLRPTTQRVKEAMFSIIQFLIEDAVVLDLFAGSGQLGIEALSRGAQSCTFVDNSQPAIKTQINNLKSTNLYEKANVVLSEGISFLKKTNVKFDIIIADPPYNSNILLKVLKLASLNLKNCGIIICEHMKGLILPQDIENIELQKQYSYGKINLSFYKNMV